MNLHEWRADYAALAERVGGDPEDVAVVHDVAHGREYVPAGASGTLVWLHGGGWVSGNLDGIDRVCRALANRAGATVLSVDYRLAPEHPFPAALDDAVAAVASVSGPVCVGGDSAGGQLAALTAARVPVRGQLLVYPALDPACDSDAMREFATGTRLTADEMRWCWNLYLAGAEIGLPDVTGAPPTAIAVAGRDPLRDDGLHHARRLREAGVPVALRVFDDMVHGFLRHGLLPEAQVLYDWLGARARAVLRPPR